MRRLSADEITEELTNEQMEILAEMMDETPVSNEWIMCAKKLTGKQRFIVYELRVEMGQKLQEEKNNSMTPEEKNEQKRNDNFYSFDNTISKSNMWSQAIEPENPNDLLNIINFDINRNNISDFIKLKQTGWYLDQIFYEKLEKYASRLDKFNVEYEISIFNLDYKTILNIDNHLFSSVLQYLIYEKTVFFVYPDLQNKVLETSDKNELINIGKTIPYFAKGRKAWSEYFKMKITYGLKVRFQQDETFRIELLKTKNLYLQCCYTNLKLGISYNSGDNLLGKILTLIRLEEKGS